MIKFEVTMNFFIRLEKELTNLPGEAAHVEMFPLRARTSEAKKNVSNYRLSAVMAILFEEEQKKKIVLIERQDYDGKHSGQIAFPGGKIETNDASPLAAALRETNEEIGITPENIQCIGQLSEVYIPVSNFLVQPFVGFMEKKPQFNPDPREVKSVITCNVNELLLPESKVITKINASQGVILKDIPAFQLENKIVWGATALMLNEIREVLLRIQ